MAKYAKTVAVDLDGVLAEYTGFKGPDEIEKPYPHAAKLLKKLNKEYKVIVFTARNTEVARNWLNEWGLLSLVDGINYCQINGRAGKPVAIAYLDDRAVRWTGDLDQALREIDGLNRENYEKDTGKPLPQKLTATQLAPGMKRRGVTGIAIRKALAKFSEAEPVFEAVMVGDQIMLMAAEDEEFKAISRAIWDKGVPL